MLRAGEKVIPFTQLDRHVGVLVRRELQVEIAQIKRTSVEFDEHVRFNPAVDEGRIALDRIVRVVFDEEAIDYFLIKVA